MTVVVSAVVALLGAAALGALWRVLRGPSILDRMIGSEVLLVLVMAALLVDMAYRGHTTTLPVVLVLSALSFTSIVSVTRFVSARKADR
jgi:multicomponent Na+:H+ antiporter subunit F